MRVDEKSLIWLTSSRKDLLAKRRAVRPKDIHQRAASKFLGIHYPGRFRAEAVVLGIVESEDLALHRRKRHDRLRPQQRLLELLLRLIAACVEAV